MVDVIGIEPTTSSLRTRRSPKLSYTPEKRFLYSGLSLQPNYYIIFKKFVKIFLSLPLQKQPLPLNPAYRKATI